MYTDFLEFWGDFLIQAAQCQRRTEEFTKWTRMGFEALEAQKAFLDAFLPAQNGNEKQAAAAEVWEKTFDEFRKSYRKFVNVFGLVSMEEYQELVRKNKSLEKKLAEKSSGFSDVRTAGDGVLNAQRAIEKGLQELIVKQSEQFKELMESMQTFHGSGLPDS